MKEENDMRANKAYMSQMKELGAIEEKKANAKDINRK